MNFIKISKCIVVLLSLLLLGGLTNARVISAQNDQLRYSDSARISQTQTVDITGSSSYYMSGTQHFSMRNSTDSAIDLSQVPLKVTFSNVPIFSGETTVRIASFYNDGHWIASKQVAGKNQFLLSGQYATLVPGETLTFSMTVVEESSAPDLKPNHVDVTASVGGVTPPTRQGKIILHFQAEKPSVAAPKRVVIHLDSSMLKSPLSKTVTHFSQDLVFKDLAYGAYDLSTSGLDSQYQMSFNAAHVKVASETPVRDSATYSLNPNYKTMTVFLGGRPFSNTSHYILPSTVPVTVGSRRANIPWHGSAVFSGLVVGHTYDLLAQELTDGQSVYQAHLSIALKSDKNVPLNYKKLGSVISKVINFKVSGLTAVHTASIRLKTTRFHNLSFVLYGLKNGDNKIAVPLAVYDVAVNSAGGQVANPNRFNADKVMTEAIRFRGKFAPVGWSQTKITMGTLYDNSTAALDALAKRPVRVAFTYAGIDGAGDPGKIVPLVDSKIPQTMGQLMLTDYQIMPVFVVYTANASGGGTGGAVRDIEIYKNLEAHYETLIEYARALEGYYRNKTNSVRSTIILSPDFLGSIYKDGEITAKTKLSIKAGSKTYGMKQVLATALKNQHIKAAIPASIVKNNTLVSYLQSINWIIGTVAPNIPYGWEDADWAGDNEGNLWLHRANTEQGLVAEKAKGEINFLNSLHYMTPVPLSDGKTTQPAFLAFDKYGANPISNDRSVFVNQGYLFNVSDWDNYFSYITDVGKTLKVPLMLFQMPGAHLPIKGDARPYYNLATAPDYLFGNHDLDLNAFGHIPGQITQRTYYSSAVNSGDYLLGLNDSASQWQKSRLSALKAADIFAVLWGGGGFATGILPEGGGAFDDHGWLYNRVKANANNVAQPQKKRIPEPGVLPVYPKGLGSYQSGDYVTTKGQVHVYQCGKYPSWCNSTHSSIYAPGTGTAWQHAWVRWK